MSERSGYRFIEPIRVESGDYAIVLAYYGIGDAGDWDSEHDEPDAHLSFDLYHRGDDGVLHYYDDEPHYTRIEVFSDPKVAKWAATYILNALTPYLDGVSEPELGEQLHKIEVMDYSFFQLGYLQELSEEIRGDIAGQFDEVRPSAPSKSKGMGL